MKLRQQTKEGSINCAGPMEFRAFAEAASAAAPLPLMPLLVEAGSAVAAEDGAAWGVVPFVAASLVAAGCGFLALRAA